MSTTTTNYGMVKPTEDEFYDVVVQNGNMNIIDTQMKANADAAAAVTGALAGKADLVDGVVPASQLPSFVDDVLEYSTLSAFPATGESGKIYVALDTNKTYRWSGSAYIEISASLALGETSSTAYRGDRGKAAYDHSLKTNNPHGVTPAQIGAATAANLTAHSDAGVDQSEAGVHGIRYYDDILAVKVGTEWVNVKTGGSGIVPGDVTDIVVKSGNGLLKLNFTDPTDSVWAGTKVVMKAGSMPTDETDGTVILDNTVSGAYSTTAFTQSGLTNGTTYYFAFFPYNSTGAFNYSINNTGSGTPVATRTMSVVIDLNSGNPSSCITYADDAVGMTAGSSAWDEFFGHYPCILQNGVELGKLKPSNFAQYEDGTAAPITTNGSDVMIAFPRRGLKITTTGTTVKISMTDAQSDSDFGYYAHTRGSTAKDVFYLGAYKAFVEGSNLYSKSGVAPAVNATIGTFRNYAQSRGTGYAQSGFYQLVFRQAMYLLKYKNLDSQTAVGQGYTGGSAAQNTGALNTSGMDYGGTSTTSRMKLFGLEDFWGNVWEWIDGLFCNASWHILTATDAFNDTGSGYTDQGAGATANVSGYLTVPQGTTATGLIAKTAGGSATTYFCDYAHLYSGCLPVFGGSWSNGSGAGAFYLNVNSSASTSSSDIGARLMYL